MLALLEAAGSLLANLLPLGIGWLVTGAVRHAATTEIFGSLVVAGALGAPPLLTGLAVEARLRLREQLGHHFDHEVARMMSGVPTVEHLASPRFHDQAQNLSEQQGSLGQAYNLLINALNNLVVPVATVAVAVNSDLRLLWLLPAAAPGLVLTRFPIRWEQAAEDSGAEHARRSRHLLDRVADAAGGAEIRTFEARLNMRALLVRETRAWRQPHQAAALRASLLSSGSLALYLAAAASVLLLIVRDGTAGRIQPGVVATAVLAIGQTQASAASARRFFLGIAKVARTVERFRWLDRETVRLGALAGHAVSPPVQLRQGLLLESVSFNYPGSERPAVQELSIDLPSAGTVAIVGDNGSGKSTLIKLLSALYRPTTGRITIDGRDLVDIHPDDWRARCSAVFHDHLHLELEVGESVGVGHLDSLHDTPTILRAVQSAAASHIVQALPLGLRTKLGHSWADGIDISGGEWQRLSLARAMMRRRPLLLLLDEPTSALDAFAEDELVRRYALASADTDPSRGLVVIVTHRLSTVRGVDLIVVMHEGRIVESGGHDELIARRGRYAELFALQATGYR